MLNDEDNTPSRHELLTMVKKHSTSLGKTNETEGAVQVEMDSRFWRGIFDLYFIRGKESRRRQDDDLIFFVRRKSPKSDIGQRNHCPYFVRRWAPKMESVVGDNVAEVDWRRSFYLNLIAHTCFTITVAICSHEVLRNRQPGQDSTLSPIYKIVKTVYASPSRVNFHLDSRKQVETSPAYPDICFAIDDFDSTFDAVVLTESDHCYCVLLKAMDGAAFPKGNQASNHSVNTKKTLFSGFVSYQLVREAYDGERKSGGLFSFANSADKLDKIYMRGPGGRGEVEVAVSGVTDQSHVSPKNPFSLGSIASRAASIARHVYSQNAFSDATPPLRCCLMSVSLPWESIAHDLLFK